MSQDDLIKIDMKIDVKALNFQLFFINLQDSIFDSAKV